MLKNILCFGDSNTHGYMPGIGSRYPRNVRWTGKLQEILGGGYYVIEEGLTGRTTAFEDRDSAVEKRPELCGRLRKSQARWI